MGAHRMQNLSSACLNSKYMAKGKLLFGNFMRFIRRTCRTSEQLFAYFCDMCRLLVSELVGPRSISCRNLEPLRLTMNHLSRQICLLGTVRNNLSPVAVSCNQIACFFFILLKVIPVFSIAQ
jgi:hypothetical protein